MEFNLFDEDTLVTHHEKIKIFGGSGLPSCGMESHLKALRDICDRRDVSGLVLTLKDLIPDYNPSAHLLKRVLGGGSGSLRQESLPYGSRLDGGSLVKKYGDTSVVVEV